jgi:adenosylcobinamide hydrolase
LKLDIPIEGIEAEVRSGNVVIQSSSPLRVLTSSVLGRSYSKSMAIVNHQVPVGNIAHIEPEKRFLETIDELGLSRQTVGLMTAANVRNVSILSKKYDELIVCAIATAGVINSAAAADEAIEELSLSTINIIVLVDGNLTQNCMVNVVMTATEAKSAALRDLDIRSRFSTEPATGTTSDTVVVACTERGKRIMFAGTATKLGEMVGKTVKETVKKAIQKQDALKPNRPLVQRLEERGIVFKRILDTAVELYNQYFDKSDEDEITQKLANILKNTLEDTNVSALLLAGIRLNEDVCAGLVPNLCLKEFEHDNSLLTAGKTLGMSIANYLAGKEGVEALLKFGEEKTGILGELEPILSDVFKGLFAGLSLKILAKRK